jgi:hypothetical protein
MKNIRDVILQGRDVDHWHKQKIRTNNKHWFLIVSLVSIVYIGHTCILLERMDSYKKFDEKLKEKNSIILRQNFDIKTLQEAVDSAVYFHEIIKTK